MDPTERFSSRVEAYARYRPDYPRGILDVLVEHAGLSSRDVVADIGSGTGKLSRLFLDHGNRVIGVEPNAAMRRSAEKLLGDHDGFRSLPGRAEATGLPDASVDVVAAAQAFHWFDPVPTRRELARILRPDGRLALIWNARRARGSELMEGYEAVLREHGTDYAQVRSHSIDDRTRLSLFGEGRGVMVVLDHRQSLSREGLLGRVASASYMPGEGEAGHSEMIRGLNALFDAHQRGGRITLEYDTRIYCGPAAIRSGTP